MVFLHVCGLQTVLHQVDQDSEEIYSTKFAFVDGKELEMKVHIDSHEWQHAIESSNKVW